MSIVRRSLNDILATPPDVDWVKLEVTTEEEIGRHEAEDGAADFAMEDAVPIQRPARVDLRAVRQRLNLSQEDFASAFGLDIQVVRAWEKGEREPDQAARVLLAVIAREPDAVRRALAAE